jgi:hypothetical protein
MTKYCYGETGHWLGVRAVVLVDTMYLWRMYFNVDTGLQVDTVTERSQREQSLCEDWEKTEQ